jgi:hypothetical protein
MVIYAAANKYYVQKQIFINSFHIFLACNSFDVGIFKVEDISNRFSLCCLVN